MIAGDTSSAVTPNAPPDDPAAAPVELKIEEYGFTAFPATKVIGPKLTYGVVISNLGDTAVRNVEVQVSFEDTAGVVVESREQTIAAVLPKSSVGVAESFIDAKDAATMTVQALPGSSDFENNTDGRFSTSGISSRVDDFGMKTTGTIMSTFSQDIKKPKAVAIYRNTSGKVIGGDFAFVNFVPGKGRAAVTIQSISGWKKAPAKTDIYVELSVLSLLP